MHKCKYTNVNKHCKSAYKKVPAAKKAVGTLSLTQSTLPVPGILHYLLFFPLNLCNIP